MVFISTGRSRLRLFEDSSIPQFFQSDFCCSAKRNPSKGERGENNIHPTVKPLRLMRYLCKIVTPMNGTVLDPFMGSGTTGVAALFEKYNFIGIERDVNYFKIAKNRLKGV